MKPLKAKQHISPEVAKELDCSEEVVIKVVDFYWRNIREGLSSLKHIRVHAANLGDFVIKHWEIDNKIRQYELWQEKINAKGLNEMHARFNCVEKIYQLKQIKSFYQEEMSRKEFIIQCRNEFKKESDNNLEE